MTILGRRIVAVGRSCRGWHWLPRLYPGIASAQYRSAVLRLAPSDLLVWGAWAWEVFPKGGAA